MIIVCGAWLVSAALLLGWWFFARADRQYRTAPICATSETGTSMTCLTDRPGVVTALSDSSVEAVVDGREVRMSLFLSGDIPEVNDLPVTVEFYSDRPVRMDGPSLHVEAWSSPATWARNCGLGGLFFLVVPPVAAAATIVDRKFPRSRRR
jgi:hypothetical protein